MSITEIVEEIELRAQTHEIGRLQEIRKEIKNRHRLAGQTIFHAETIKDTYAFHYGGRKELQFNVGTEPGDRFRHGVAFSFEPSQSLPDPDLLVPSVKRFNGFLRRYPNHFPDMRMWHWYKDEQRSADYRPVPIEPDLIRNGIFVFLGKMQSSKKIDFDVIVEDFDRLLTLYRFVEGNGVISPNPLTESTTLYLASTKSTKPNTFLHAVQLAAQRPIGIGALISKLQAFHRTPEGEWLVPESKKDHDMVIRVRATYAANHGYLTPVGTAPSGSGKSETNATFGFTPGCTVKLSKTKASYAERQLDVVLRHNEIQKALHDYLASVHGINNVGTEVESGGGRIDVVVRHRDKCSFYEIKTAVTARGCISEALAQLLEYSYWPGAQVAERLIVVGEPTLDSESEQYLATLRGSFSLPIEYEQFDFASGTLIGHRQMSMPAG